MPFSHSSTGICPLRSSGLGSGCSVIVSVGLPPDQHWRARGGPVTISASGSGPPVASAHVPLLKRAMVPWRSWGFNVVLDSLFMGLIFRGLICRRERIGSQPAFRRDLFDAHGPQAAGSEQVFQAAPKREDWI